MVSELVPELEEVAELLDDELTGDELLEDGLELEEIGLELDDDGLEDDGLELEDELRDERDERLDEGLITLAAIRVCVFFFPAAFFLAFAFGAFFFTIFFFFIIPPESPVAPDYGIPLPRCKKFG